MASLLAMAVLVSTLTAEKSATVFNSAPVALSPVTLLAEPATEST